MPWNVAGLAIECCTCQSFCICNLGPAVLPQGWHAGACVWEIQHGASEGIDLSGTTVAMMHDMPGDFLSGNGTARVYIGDSADPDQRRELESIFTGSRPGAFDFYETSFSVMVPVRDAAIRVVGGEEPSVAIDDIAQLTLRRRRTHSGKQTTLNDALYVEAFGISSSELADATGSTWSDPHMRSWSSGGAGAIAMFALDG